jgi:hypothetical protein
MYILRIAKVYEPDVDALPAEFRKALTKQDMEAIRSGPEFFAGLAGPQSPGWLRKVLKRCSESGYELQFCSRGGKPYRPYFRFHWQGAPAISLPRPGALRADLPAFLRRIYEIIGEFCENDFDMAGGLLAAEDVGPISETGIWVEPGGPIEPSSAFGFLESFSGSRLCYLTDGGGAWLEACHFRRVKNLEREVARYFEALIKGTRATLDRD